MTNALSSYERQYGKVDVAGRGSRKMSLTQAKVSTKCNAEK